MNPDLVDKFVKLKDRLLWIDGDSSFYPDELCKKVLSGVNVGTPYVTEISKDIEIFNNLNPNKKICIKENVKNIDTSWNIPDKYLKLDVDNYVYDLLIKEIENKEKQFSKDRYNRVIEELKLFKQYGMLDLLRTIIYIVDSFREHNIVWGTGRGSSCCSYILYLIGLHDVDSVKYELELSEFFR